MTASLAANKFILPRLRQESKALSTPFWRTSLRKSWKLTILFLPLQSPPPPPLHNTTRHSVHRVPPLAWTVYVFYPIDRMDLHPDLNQNLIGLFLSPTELIDQVSSESVHNFLRCRVWPFLSIEKNHLKILVSGSGSPPKSNHFLLITPSTYPPNFVSIHL